MIALTVNSTIGAKTSVHTPSPASAAASAVVADAVEATILALAWWRKSIARLSSA